ncbi:MAG: PDZ domain-containing protein [Bacteroidetes bacterium]|nr:PDZ domain-containing protein [Bacteroidota bacterium]
MKPSCIYVLPLLLLLTIPGSADAHAAVMKELPALAQEEPGAWLGVRITSFRKSSRSTDENAQAEGVYVEEVVSGSPAEHAGIKAGDRLLTFNNSTIDRSRDLINALEMMTEGDRATMTLLRGGKQETVEVVLGAAKERPLALHKRIRIPRSVRPPIITTPGFSSSGGNHGLRLETLGSQLAGYFNVPDGKGVLVKAVKEQSEADKAGFQAGDVIIHAGKKTIENVRDMRSVLGAFDAGEKIPVAIIRKGNEMTLELTAVEARNAAGYDSAFDMLGDMLPRVLHYKFNGDRMEELDDFEDMGIDIDMSEIDDAVRRVRIILDGKKIELEGLGERLREHFDSLREDIDVDVDAVEIRHRKL